MRVAFVHDYLTQYGGAERLLDVLYTTYADYPRHIYTSMIAPDQLPAHIRDWPVTTSVIARLPLTSKTHRGWLPFYPQIFRKIGRSIDDADIVIADTSAWSHHAKPAGDTPFLAYCHSPARFLHGDRHYLAATSIPTPLARASAHLFDRLREQDIAAAQLPDRIIANSAVTRERIGNVWGRDAEVIYPPIHTARFRPSEEREIQSWFLVVSRLVPHKWIERAIQASNRTGLPLRIIGAGRADRALRKVAGPQVEFRGPRSDDEVISDMQVCQALILPAPEDFGMTAVEAQAAGRPVIGACDGGVLETVRDGETGILVPVGDIDALAEAMYAVTDRSWDRGAILSQAEQFDICHFQRRIRTVVNELVQSKKSASTF